MGSHLLLDIFLGIAILDSLALFIFLNVLKDFKDIKNGGRKVEASATEEVLHEA